MEGATPCFRRPYSVSFAIKQAVEKEMERVVSNGKLKKFNNSDWAAPNSASTKEWWLYMLDYKLTFNPVLQVDNYSLQNTVVLLATLAGGQRFTKVQPIPTDVSGRAFIRASDYQYT